MRGMDVIEMVDVVTENNEIVTKKSRKDVHNTGEWHRGVHIFLFDGKGNLLVQIRGNKKTKFPRKYDCSVSEHLIAGESFLNGAKRGLKEELGIEGVVLKKIVRFRMNYDEGDNMISELYIGKLNEERSHRTFSLGEEVQNIQFMDIRKLKELMENRPDDFTPWLRELLKWFLSLPSEVEEMEE